MLRRRKGIKERKRAAVEGLALNRVLMNVDFRQSLRALIRGEINVLLSGGLIHIVNKPSLEETRRITEWLSRAPVHIRWTRHFPFEKDAPSLEED